MENIVQILVLRSLIARLGEKDFFGWWDSEVLTSAGQVALGRLFPKTGAWAGIELSIRAARLIHANLLSELRAVSLFDITQPYEKTIDDFFYRAKAKATQASDALDSKESFDIGNIVQIVSRINPDSSYDARTILASSGLISVNLIEQVISYRGQESGKLFCLGELGSQELSTQKFVKHAERLAAAYSLSSPGNLVVPYYLIKPN
ncbi:MAG: BrxE family protein [Peptococcaceae bacterium]|nr:BrxE family protein [Peptococcaceae bacterium]